METPPSPDSLMARTEFFIREHAGLMKLTDTYDILDPQTQQLLGLAKEEPPGWAKVLRLLLSKRLMPTRINVYQDQNQAPVFSIRRGSMLLSSRVLVYKGEAEFVGYFKSKLFSLGGAFRVFNAQDQQIAEIKGDWKGWNFKFLANDGSEIGLVTKKWAGIGKELFTSADNYIISIKPEFADSSVTRLLLLGAGLAIDTVLKEK